MSYKFRLEPSNSSGLTLDGYAARFLAAGTEPAGLQDSNVRRYRIRNQGVVVVLQAPEEGGLYAEVQIGLTILGWEADEIRPRFETWLRLAAQTDSMISSLPASLAKNKIPSALCELFNRDPESPFFDLLIRQTTDRKEDKTAVIADNSLLQVIKSSINSPHGCLYQHRNVATGEIDVEAVRKTVNLFWSEVRNTFPEAWGVSPQKSRLMAGVGINAMGVLMDRIMGNLHPDDASARKQVTTYLQRLKPSCAWTSGSWEILDGAAWNTLQNTSQDIRRLSNALVRAYIQVETS